MNAAMCDSSRAWRSRSPAWPRETPAGSPIRVDDGGGGRPCAGQRNGAWQEIPTAIATRSQPLCTCEPRERAWFRAPDGTPNCCSNGSLGPGPAPPINLHTVTAGATSGQLRPARAPTLRTAGGPPDHRPHFEASVGAPFDHPTHPVGAGVELPATYPTPLAHLSQSHRNLALGSHRICASDTSLLCTHHFEQRNRTVERAEDSQTVRHVTGRLVQVTRILRTVLV